MTVDTDQSADPAESPRGSAPSPERRRLALGALASGAYVTVVDVFRRHSTSLALSALLATYLGKISWYMDRESIAGRMRMGFLAFIADDLLFWSAVVAAALAVEMYMSRRWLKGILIGLCGLLAFVALGNVFWLRGTGGQLDVSVLEVVATRAEEVMPIIRAGLGGPGLAMLIAAALLPIVLPFLFRAKWKRDARTDAPRPATLAFPLLLALLGGAGLLEQRAPGLVGWRVVASNVHVGLLRDLIERPAYGAPPRREDPSPRTLPVLVPEAELPNVVVVLLEATSLRATSLAPDGPPTTPFLARLAASGLQALSMRAVVPHTTKSVYALLCGTYPAMQTEILETADDYPSRCLAEILAERGYATALLQSADGRFEQRPRLAANLGFEHFAALDDLRPRGEPLGYLGGDDMALVEPAIEWARSQPRPFFMVVLTSATHHPYQLPRWLARARPGSTEQPPPVRYALLVQAADEMLRRIVEGVETVPNGRPTIVLVMGDHGEAFGEHGLRQHDNAFHEEGLRVPLVIRAEGQVEAGSSVSGPRSLLDVTPTVLDLVGIPYDEARFDGRSLVRRHPRPPRPYFACWYNDVCAGFVTGTRKLVALIGAQSWLAVDLSADPLERRPIVESPQDRRGHRETVAWYRAHHYARDGLTWSRRTLFDGAWVCAEGHRGRCRSTRP